MISKDKHQKHVKLNKPQFGDFGRLELGFLGTSCRQIQQLAKTIIGQLSQSYGLAYVDADHQEGDQLKAGGGDPESLMQYPGLMELRNKIVFRRLDMRLEEVSVFEQREWLNRQDLVLVNANHFRAMHQVLVIDPKKSMDKKLSRLTNVCLILMKDGATEIPVEIRNHLPYWKEIPVFAMEETRKLVDFVRKFVADSRTDVIGLVLIGGKSSRMGRDKYDLSYHGKSQKDYMMDLLGPYCEEVFLSCNPDQAAELEQAYPLVVDSVLDLGPFGGLLSAFRNKPDKAWLSVACDLPFLTGKTVQHLLENRNPSKLATAFLDPNGEFPEPLITIWEPRAYPVLFRFLSQGYSCPRKVLINSDIELLQAPDPSEFRNVNYPEEHQAALAALKGQGS
ncbi:Molybdopterin-guanine dinucleotide biosynthesis protein A [Cyclobacterium lianum]|uniref:Probable molybdenum cofactor guanylyltransferase n=1 Tax=Cyclobacterium lianum TaxID=388280 RepID=A0A1M7L2U1_9BACT|nr:NTP transferase domain-containing protein [Cyclobacterium lianum]SHM72000.1 Molybdopterin-guanine dinucleotide biosynthesis protein A [Cyclobacterium lianum]